jgi:hypothetical protein
MTALVIFATTEPYEVAKAPPTAPDSKMTVCGNNSGGSNASVKIPAGPKPTIAILYIFTLSCGL